MHRDPLEWGNCGWPELIDGLRVPSLKGFGIAADFRCCYKTFPAVRLPRTTACGASPLFLCSSTVNRNLDTEEANAAGGGLDVYIRPIPAVYFLVKRQIL